MRVILSRMQILARRLAAVTVLLPITACGGGDLLLPDDRTPVELLVVSGNGQSAVVGSPVPHQLVVEARDGKGRPAEGAVVVFEFVDPPNGGAIAPPVTETGTNGRAAVGVTLGAPAGEQPVDARLDDPDHDLSVRFLLTAIRSNTGGGGDEGDGEGDDGGNGGADNGGNGGNGGGGGGGGGGDGGDDGDDGDDGKGKGKGGGNNGGNGKGQGDD